MHIYRKRAFISASAYGISGLDLGSFAQVCVTQIGSVWGGWRDPADFKEGPADQERFHYGG